MFGSTAIAVSFCEAAAVSWLTVTSGGRTLVPSSGLESTKVGVIGGFAGPGLAASAASASSWRKADIRICRPAVPFTEATLPASVLML
ncbi:MAG: hypothetical protein AUI15_24820 [Actinobacteria bacterium 13_2_20CM_2_66_6]|nr:MAG: hypothetical protein AUI15_24820 [Actinobacteria bacterium 13_2_20CM_2_66_6]